MIKESEFRSKVIEKEFHKSLAMTEKDHNDFNNSTKCWICKEAYEKHEVKVKDHDHVTTKCRGPTHQECSLNLSLSKKKLLCFMICKTMIHILSFKKLEDIISK